MREFSNPKQGPSNILLKSDSYLSALSLLFRSRDELSVHFLQIYIEGLCHGNLLKSEALEIGNIFKIYLTGKPLPVEMRHGDQVICLPSGANLVRDASVKNKLEPNSVIEVHNAMNLH